jgi:hypothetical protein
MTTRFFIPGLVTVLRLAGRLLLPGLFLILPLFTQTVLAQDAKNNWGEAMKINPGSKLTGWPADMELDTGSAKQRRPTSPLSIKQWLSAPQWAP